MLNLFSTSLSVVKGRFCVSRFLSHFALPARKVRVIAIGKAAADMMQGLLDRYADRIDAGLIITKVNHTQTFPASAPSMTQIESAHPYPDERSIIAGHQLLQFIEESPNDAGFVFLISGGTSSLVDVLPETCDSQQLHELNHWLLAQGWPIDVMNQIRKSVSLIKAGRLARYVAGHPVLQLVISDVPGDELSVIGSGLLVPDKSSAAGIKNLPSWVRDMQVHVPAAPAANEACYARIESHIIASNQILRAEIARLAQASGYCVRSNRILQGDATTQGKAIAQTLIAGEPGLYVWGGEPVVTLPDNPGQGGRCQQLALAAAEQIAGQDNVTLLAVGTDGTDGPGDVAGGLVDGHTLERGYDAGAMPVQTALQHADAGSFLAASGDLVDTGPTGTNVMDVVIGLKT